MSEGISKEFESDFHEAVSKRKIKQSPTSNLDCTIMECPPNFKYKNLNKFYISSAVANYTRSLDWTRPVTAVTDVSVYSDRAAKHLDIISFNRYNGWYQNAGQLNMITGRVVDEAMAWYNKHNKPVLMSEYGADTIAGLHLLPAFVWSEEYQKELFSRHFRAFDILRKRGFFIGEFIWNFADFKTKQSYTRVDGNKKGVFTRQRQPKEAAHHVRKRYFSLAADLDGCSLPNDLFPYISQAVSDRLENP